jgi:hypothetical protein
VKSASSGDYAAGDDDGRDTTRPADASSDVSTNTNARDVSVDPKPLPEPTTELFVAAGALVAERLERERAGPLQIKEVLQRVVEQCVALSR